MVGDLKVNARENVGNDEYYGKLDHSHSFHWDLWNENMDPALSSFSRKRNILHFFREARNKFVIGPIFTNFLAADL